METHTKASNGYLTLTEAAKLAPGRPTANAIWRWCRRGVKSRGGERVRLEHIRAGGQIFTTSAWLEQFGRTLAEADARYFDLAAAAVEAARANEPTGRRRRQSATCSGERQRELDEIDRELDAEGL